MGLRAVLVALFFSVATVAVSAEQPSSPIVYPRENSIVGSRVNLVLDPTEVPYFQVIVGRTEYPVVDTSTGKHAYQGLDLEPGLNTITVKVFAPPPDDNAAEQGAANEKAREQSKEQSKKSLILVSAWTRQVFSKVELLTTKKTPSGFKRDLFHSRERETGCAGCHDLEAPRVPPKKPEDMICHVCHRKVPTGKYVHGPVAVWYCLACHNPDAYPVKYQFTSIDPWKVEKTAQTVRPAVFTIPVEAVFKPQTETLLSDITTIPLDGKSQKKDRKKEKELAREREAELRKNKEKQRELFKAFLEYLKFNPTDYIRVEVHADTAPLPEEKGKKAKGFKNVQQLTEAQAKVVAKVLKEYGIQGKNRVLSVGMGSALPKATNETKDGRDLNKRIEIVVYPPEAKVQNSMNLPVLTDRERVNVNIAYARGAAIRSLKVIEPLPAGMHYVKGSGTFRGGHKDPLAKGQDLIWQIGDPGVEFQESLSYVVRKEKGTTAPVSPIVRLSYTTGKNEETRDFDPTKSSKRALTVAETCEKCHPDMLAGRFKHGPAAMGYCTLCHDPHASNYAAWTRKQSWRLCTTCHEERKSGVHLIAGFSGLSHPTKKWPDPTRPGKRLACVSCHSPHSSQTSELLALDVRNKFEICRVCHRK